MAESVSQIGRLLRVIGFAFSYLTVLVVLVAVIYFFFELDWQEAIYYSTALVVGGIPSFVIGQLVALHGTRAILNGVSVQNSVIEGDADDI